MVDVLEARELTQLTETYWTFELKNFADEVLGSQPLNLLPIRMTSGTSPFAPTIRLTVKRKVADSDAFALWRKVVPPYPATTNRFGIIVDRVYDVVIGLSPDGSKTIAYMRGQPWWFWYSGSYPLPPAPTYTYDPNNPPTNWDPLGSWGVGYGAGFPPDWGRGINPFEGEVSFLLLAYETWWPAGTYHGWIEVWMSGNGTAPATPPQLTIPFSVRINARPGVTVP